MCVGSAARFNIYIYILPMGQHLARNAVVLLYI